MTFDNDTERIVLIGTMYYKNIFTDKLLTNWTKWQLKRKSEQQTATKFSIELRVIAAKIVALWNYIYI